MNRQQRHAAILRILRDRSIGTQTELADSLRAAGHDVVQTTVSRDIHELGLIKVRSSWMSRDARRLHDVVTGRPQRVGELRLRPDGPGRAGCGGSRHGSLCWRFMPSTSVRIRRASEISSSPTTSGGARRRTFGPAVRRRAPRRGRRRRRPARAGRARRRAAGPARARPGSPGSASTPDASRLGATHGGKQRIVDASVQTATGAAHRHRGNVEP